MNPRFKKFALLLLAVVLIFSAGQLQRSMNRDRDSLGLTRTAVLENAPPALAFTTVALGGFRGLISNFLWIRANDLQQDDKFFEAAQLADWITQLEPTFTQVWLFQAWNMAYNISVKFKENSPGDYTDRWHWVERGIKLLRDDGLRYNPNSILIYRELGWFFQHKMGQNLDDGNMFYKHEWADEMRPFFGPKGTNFDSLLNPRTPDDFKLLQTFTNEYKLDPAFVKSVDEKYGPFDWRLPEAHAIYWGEKGREEAEKYPDRVKLEDVTTVRRIIYQSLLQAFHHGRINSDPFSKTESLGPNVDIIPHVNAAYTNFFAEEPDKGQKDGILRAHRNFLRDAIYFLYEADRRSEAQQWFNYLAKTYPDKPIIETDPTSLPSTLTLDEYAVAVIRIDIGETSQERVTAAINGFLVHGYYALATGDDDRYQNLLGMARNVYGSYTGKTYKYKGDVRIPLPPFDEMQKSVLRYLLTPQNGLPYAARAALVSQLGLPASALLQDNAEVDTGTNAVPVISTNAPATNAVPPVQ